MKKVERKTISEARLLRHFKSKRAAVPELNPDEFPEENEQCARKLINAINQTPSVPLDAVLLPPLI